MTEAEKTELLATMTDQQGSVLSAYLAIAGDKVLRKLYPFDDTIKEVPERYHMTQVEIAAYLLNKRGAEGETAHSENGISRSYEDGDVPSPLLRDIVPYAGVVK